MSFDELLISPASRLVTVALAHFLWQGLVIAGLLVLIVELLGIRRSALRYACSLAALLLMTACPIATLTWLSLAHGNATLASGPLGPASSESWRSILLGAQQAQSPSALSAQLVSLQPYLLAVWLAGVVTLGARLLGGLAGVIQLRRSRQALPAELAEIVEQLGRRLHFNALPLVFLSRQVAEAMAVGVVRPLVLIPAAWATEMPLAMLEAVIAHELAHLRRRDLWINLWQRIVETLLFYHPAVWWLSRRLRIERELCADELAVAATGQRLVYAQALEQVAHWRRAEVRPLLAAFLRGEQDMRLLQRVRNVLGPTAGDRSRLWPVGILALALPAALWAASLGLIGPLNGIATADEDRQTDARRDRDDEERAVKRKPREREGRKEVIEEKVIRKQALAEEEARTKFTNNDVARIHELSVLVKQLVERVEKLQAELNEIRGDRKKSADDREEGEIRKRKPAREQSEQEEQILKQKQAGQDKQAVQRARRQAEEQKREAIEREEEARERAEERKRDAVEREKETKERVIIEKKPAAGRKKPTDGDDDSEAALLKGKLSQLVELKKLEALKELNLDKQALVEKIQAQVEKAAGQAEDAVKRALAQKKQILFEQKESQDKQPPKKKPADDDDES